MARDQIPVSLSLSQTEKTWLDRTARENNLSRSALMQQMVRFFMDKNVNVTIISDADIARESLRTVA